MSFSPSKYYHYLFKTIEAINTNQYKGTFINNPGFGNIFSIINSKKYNPLLNNHLDKFYDEFQKNDIINSLKQASLTSYYTPIPLIKGLLSKLKENKSFIPKNILEPCAGNGLFVKELMPYFPQAHYTAFEKDILTSQIFEHNFSNFKNISFFGLPFEQHSNTSAPKSFDLVISNIPFGSAKIYDPVIASHPRAQEATRNIHTYFTFKSLDLLNDKGIAVIITTKNLLDKNRYADSRQLLLENADFIGGLRMPDNTFESENTKVVADLLIFQKNLNKERSPEQIQKNALFINSDIITVSNNEVQINSYFNTNRDLILGTLEEGGLYSNKDFTITSDATMDQLAAQVALTLEKNKFFDSLVFDSPLRIIPPEPISTKSEIYTGNLRPGNLIIHHQKVKKIATNNTLETLKVNSLEFDKISKLIALRDNYLQLINTEDEVIYQQAQDNLNYIYDNFVFQYGFLNDKINSNIAQVDIQGALLLGLEKREGNSLVKADIFSTQLTKIKTVSHKYNLEDAVYYSLNKSNGIDIGIIQELTDKAEKDILSEGIQKGLIFLNPTDNGIILSTSEVFFSGPIYSKINFYKNGNFGNYTSYIDKIYLDTQIQALEKIKPPMVLFEDLDIQLHENWFSLKIVEQFIADTYTTEIILHYNESTSQYMAKTLSSDYSLIKKFYVHSESRSYNFNAIVEAALNQSIPYITKGPKDNKVTDRAKMMEIKIRMDLLYKDFYNYVLSRPELKKQLEWEFYKRFDAHVKPKYDGKHLNFEGLSKYVPHGYQKDTVSGIIQNEGLLVNMEVGYGKTLTMALAAVKMKELGITSKTLIIGLNSTISQLELSFLDAFPNLKIITGTSKNIQGPKKRELFFSQIINNDYDIVLMSHDTFKFIPQSEKIIIEIIKEELENLTRDLRVIFSNDYDINKRTLKGLQTRKANLEASLKTHYNSLETAKDNTLDFEKMNIGHIMVDESHKFKNLMYTTRHYRVSGLNTSNGSDKSKNLLASIRTLQAKANKDFQASFLSGTPISNSITEAFVIFKYLIPNKLKAMGIYSFDQWAQVFAKKTFEFEPTLSGDYKLKERFRSFKKLKLLSNLYNEAGIVVNHKTHKIDRPKPNIEVHEIEPNMVQRQYFKQVKMFLTTGNGKYLYGDKEYSTDQKTAVSLIAHHHLRYAAIDVRLLEPSLPDSRHSKLRTIAKNIYETYLKSNDFKGTQAVFSDIGTPKKSFNVYDEIKRLLVEEYGIPHKEVDFIHNYKTNAQKQKVYAEINSGNIRIILGSTEKLGTGTNIQDRLIKIHHVDFPYRPTDNDQRNGRGIRAGNIYAKSNNDNKVDVAFYVVKDSADAVMLNHINTKKNFIDQLTNGTIKFNTLDLGPVDDSGNIDYQSMLAISNNNPLFLEKEDLKKKLEELKMEKRILKQTHYTAEAAISFQKSQLDSYGSILERLNKDSYLYEAASSDKEYLSNLLCEGGHISNSLKEIGQRLIHTGERLMKTKGNHQLATFKDSKLELRSDGSEYSLVVRTPNGGYSYGSKQIVVNPETMGLYVQNALKKIPEMINKYSELENEAKQTIKANEKILDVKFEKNDQIEEIRHKMVLVDEKLAKIEEQNNRKNDKDNDMDNGLTV